MRFVYRFLGPVLLVFTLVMLAWGLCIAMGWIGLEKSPTFIAVMFAWFGVYFFFVTKPLEKERTGVLRRVVHIAALPLAVMGYLTFKGSLDPAAFWPTLNMAMLCIAGYGVVLLTNQSAQSQYIKWFMALYVFALLVLTLVHMRGYFENGKLLSMMVFAGFGIQIAMIMFTRKRS